MNEVTTYMYIAVWLGQLVKFIYSEKATKFCKISTLLLPTVHTVKSKVKISQNFVAFSEYMNFKHYCDAYLAGDITFLKEGFCTMNNYMA